MSSPKSIQSAKSQAKKSPVSILRSEKNEMPKIKNSPIRENKILKNDQSDRNTVATP